MTRGIALKDGTGVAVECAQHSDPLAEAVRWQVCEAELIQAIGRGRGVNRTAETPLDIDVLADVVFPAAVDTVEEWRPPGLDAVMGAEGVFLTRPADIAKAWPETWSSNQAVKDWLRQEQGGIRLYRSPYKGKLHRVRYQMAGPSRNGNRHGSTRLWSQTPAHGSEPVLGRWRDYRLIGRNLREHARS